MSNLHSLYNNCQKFNELLENLENEDIVEDEIDKHYDDFEDAARDDGV